MVKSDGVCSNELLHAMFPLTVSLARPTLGHRSVLAGVDRRGGLVGLARSSVKGHHPVVRILMFEDLNRICHQSNRAHLLILGCK